MSEPRVKKRRKRLVRLAANAQTLAAWRRRTEALLQQRAESTASITPVDTVPDKARNTRHAKQPTLDPWSLSGTATATVGVAALTLTPRDHVALLAQRQLVAIDLLEHSANAQSQTHSQWTPGALCKASALTAKQLQILVQEGILVIEEAEVQRGPLLGLTIAAANHCRSRPINNERWMPSWDSAQSAPILLHGVTGSGKTEVYLQALAAVIARASVA